MRYQLTPASGRQDQSRLRSRNAPSTQDHGSVTHPVSVTLFTGPDPGTVRAWAHLVSSTPGGDVTQLPAWADLWRQAGFLPLYLLARQDDRLVGGALVLQRQLPVLGVVGYLPYGPVLAPWAPRDATARALSTALADLGHRHLGGLFVQPPEGGDDLSDQLLARGFDPSRAGTAPATSIRIDLTPAVDELRRGLSKSNRRRTRGWAQRGLTVRLGGLADLPAVADLVAGTAAHQELEPVGLEYLTALYEELAPGGQVQVFLAEVDGAPVAVELCTGCGGVLKSRLTGMARGGPAAKSGVPAALVWNAMVWAKANGYHAFDFGGIDAELVHRIPAGPLDRLPGPAAFQASFGGQPFRYPPPVELLSSPLQRVGYDLARCSSAGDGLVASVRRAIRGGTGE